MACVRGGVADKKKAQEGPHFSLASLFWNCFDLTKSTFLKLEEILLHIHIIPNLFYVAIGKFRKRKDKAKTALQGHKYSRMCFWMSATFILLVEMLCYNEVG